MGDELEACATECTETIDGVEHYREATHGHLCGSCYGRILYRLNEAPVIVHLLRSQLHTIGAVDTEAVRVGGSKETPLPFRDGHLEAADEVFSTLANWAVSHASAMGVTASLPAWLRPLIDMEKDARHLPANLTAQTAAQRTRDLTDWLREWAESVAWSIVPASLKAYHDDVVDLIHRCRSRAGLSRPRVKVVDRTGWVCRLCLHPEGEIDVPDVGPIVARCKACGAVFPMPELERTAA
ncbi:hypothetical protein [Microbacterium sp. KNMS]